MIWIGSSSKFSKIVAGLSAGLLLIAASSGAAYAASTAPTSTAPDFSFDGFAGTYYLDRDSAGVAKLTTQEDMFVRFPYNGSFYGIKRALPVAYQGHNLDLNIISVADATDSPVNYTVSTVGGNKVIETGDHSIVLSGLQSYRIKYQSSGVASFYPDRDEFLINVNGRGWQETFASVKAFIHLSSSFSADLSAKPVCYIGYKNLVALACTIKSQSEPDGQLINAATTQQLGANQSLIVKLDFKKGTFQQKKASSSVKLITLSSLAVVTLFGGLWFLRVVYSKR